MSQSEDLKGMSSFPQQEFSHRERSRSPDRSIDVCQSSSPSRTLTYYRELQRLKHQVLRSVGTLDGEITLSAAQPSHHRTGKGSSRINHFLRCITHRLGSPYGRGVNWWSLDEGGEDPPRKCSRTDGSLSRSENLCGQQVRFTYYSPDRQYHSHIIPEQERGYTLPRSSDLSILIWQWCLERSLTIHAIHIPGTQNSVADSQSRRGVKYSDWMLDPVIFSAVAEKWGLPDIDLFAAHHNTQLRRFFSYPDAE